ncbi:MAG: amidohydrolase family protein [Thermomicrobiales bacterium]
MAVTLEREQTTGRTRTPLIDCDIHNAPSSPAALRAYLPARWRAYHERFGVRGYAGGYYPKANPNAARADAWPPEGPPGSSLPFLREQLLDAWHIEYGILNCLVGTGARQLEYGAAMARAVNDWQIAEWLEPEPRLRAAIVVQHEDGDLAAAEIERLGDDKRFAQVLLTVRTSEPLGRRRYWPIYEAATNHDLPIGIHFGGGHGHPLTGAGWPSYYIEDHTGMAQSFQAQMISLVCDGVFENFPTLKVVLIEGGFAWLPPLMWRLDHAWARLRDEVPDLSRKPSEYIRDQCWITTQPMEEPTQPAQFHQLLDHLGMNDRLLFATDYPHWDFDAPDQALPVRLAPPLERAIMAGNARQLYRLPDATS